MFLEHFSCLYVGYDLPRDLWGFTGDLHEEMVPSFTLIVFK